MSQIDLLASLRVASPCDVSWDGMTGNERVRFCSSCKLNVYNFSAMTSNEVRSLIAKSEGRVCGRLYRRADGTLITRDCPVGLQAFRRRVRRIVGAVFATVLSLSSVALGQSSKKDTQSCSQAAVSFERTKDKGQIGDFTGVVADANGARIPGASIKLTNNNDKSEQTTRTNDDGAFTFSGVKDGTYSVNISAIGFKDLMTPQVELSSKELTRSDIRLASGAPIVMTGIVEIAPQLIPDIEYKNGTFIIRGDAIRKLPLP